MSVESITVSPATLSDLSYIDSLQRKNAEDISFYPKSVFEREIEHCRILLASVNREPAGYIYHGSFCGTLRIHQACIQYDLCGQLYGSKLVTYLIDLCRAARSDSISLRCGSDIAANGFWKAMGFYCQSISKGGVRRMRDINNWRLDIQPQLFTIETEPSTRQKSASLWRRNKGDNKSQFVRGASLLEYRALLGQLDADRVRK